ncbi:MAG: hypothetical protein Q7U57_03850 [Methylovulum sp.]|nr:hypothetical protein [Methylovulum sp.]
MRLDELREKVDKQLKIFTKTKGDQRVDERWGQNLPTPRKI